MTILVCQLLFMLGVILVAAEVFTNALEHLGERLAISEGVTGSLFAAVGTALPETLIPLLALFAGTNSVAVNEEIGVGAILGAPLMLSTLAFALMALSAMRSRGIRGTLQPERSGLVRDLNFFLFAFMLATLAMFVPKTMPYALALISALLLLTYFIYVLLTLQASKKLVEAGHATEADKSMLLHKLGLPMHLLTILLQLGVGLVLLVLGAKGFIHYVAQFSDLLHISALLLSLLIIPIATELPEKINSFLWIGRNKDTLAFGNLTGAMVFQGTLLPAIGIMLTPWQPRTEVAACIIITLIATFWLRLHARNDGIPIWVLLVNGALYVTYLTITLWLAH